MKIFAGDQHKHTVVIQQLNTYKSFVIKAFKKTIYVYYLKRTPWSNLQIIKGACFVLYWEKFHKNACFSYY